MKDIKQKQEELQAIVHGWEVKTTSELCEELGIEPGRAHYLIKRIKDVAESAGYSLPPRKKTDRESLNSFIVETLDKSKLAKKKK